MEIGWTFVTNAVPLAVGIGGLLWAARRAFPRWFLHPLASRALMFAPFVLGIGLGFAAYIFEANKTPITTGLAAGALAHLAYKAFRERVKDRMAEQSSTESEQLPHKLE